MVQPTSGVIVKTRTQANHHHPAIKLPQPVRLTKQLA